MQPNNKPELPKIDELMRRLETEFVADMEQPELPDHEDSVAGMVVMRRADMEAMAQASMENAVQSARLQEQVKFWQQQYGQRAHECEARLRMSRWITGYALLLLALVMLALAGRS